MPIACKILRWGFLGRLFETLVFCKKLTSYDAGPVTISPPPPPPEIVAEYTSPWVECEYGPVDAPRQMGQSRMVLRVRPDPEDLTITDVARLHYDARLYLRDLNAVVPLPETEVGKVQSYKMSKSTALVPRTLAESQAMGWVQQFLQPDPMPEDGEVMDMALLLQCLFDQTGRAEFPPTLQPIHNIQLNTDSLVYIKLVFIQPAYQRQRMVRVLFDTYYHCLRRLPECRFAPSQKDIMFINTDLMI